MRLQFRREYIRTCPHCQQPLTASGKIKFGGVRVIRCAGCAKWVWQPEPAANFWLGLIFRLGVLWFIGQLLIPSPAALLAWRTQPVWAVFAVVMVVLMVVNPIVWQLVAMAKQRQITTGTPPPNDNRPIEI